MRNTSRPLASLALESALFALTGACQSQRTAERVVSAETVPQIVIVCEHGSVKSLIAVSFFNRAAARRGLSFRAVSRGVTPDKSVPTQVAEELRQDGFDVAAYQPLPLAHGDLASAARVIAIGVDLSSMKDDSSSPIQQWEDVPPASVDYAASRDALIRHIDILLRELQVAGQE